MNWSKFIIFMKIDDPYVWPAIVGKVKEKMESFHTDHLLVILVNIAHSLSSEAANLFTYCSAHFASKLDRGYEPSANESSLKEEDIPKIMTIFGEHNMLNEALLSAILAYVDDNMMFIKMQNLASICVAHTTYCQKKSRDRFLSGIIDRVLSNISYASDEVFYKFLWAYSKDNVIGEVEMLSFLKAFENNHIQFSNKLFIKSLILLTQESMKEQYKQIYNIVGKWLCYY
jgi:hypothetical protein